MQGRDVAIRTIIVDDSRTFRALLAKWLASVTGFTVVGSGRDGPEAVELCRSIHCDLVIVDLQMPGYNGIEVARRLRALDGFGARIVLLSAFADEGLFTAALRRGVDACVAKEEIAWNLEPTVARLLTGHPQGGGCG